MSGSPADAYARMVRSHFAFEIHGVRRAILLLAIGISAAACVRPASNQVVVPNLVGTHRDAAIAALRAAGLRYRVEVEPLAIRTCPSFSGLVVTQVPRGGTPALAWTVVTVVSFQTIPPGEVTGTACVPPP